MSNESQEEVDQREPWQKNPEFNLGLVIVISLGFFTTSVWSFYNSQVQLALNDLFGNLFLVAFIMTVDNIIGVVLQPYTGSLSDRTKTKFGRRMPFLMIGVPISAASFFLLGITKDNPVLYILVILVFCTSMAFWRAPIVALMPDFVHPRDRTKGNAIVNVLGGIGTAILSLIGGMIIEVNYALAFGVLAIVMIIAFLVLFLTVKEPDTRRWDFSELKDEETGKEPGLIDNLRKIWNEEDKSMVYMLLAIFCWFITYNTSESLIAIYAQTFFDSAPSQASFLVTVTALAFLAFAYFSVKLAGKYGRRKTIMLGLIIWTISFIIGPLFEGAENFVYFYLILLGMGVGWACININSIAMVWAMAPNEKSTGVYTGLYYSASFISQIAGPLTFGFIFEYIWGLRYMLAILSILLVAAFICMSRVTRGEVQDHVPDDPARAEAEAI